MPSEDKTAIALAAIGSRKQVFLSALANTLEQIRGLLAGTSDSAADQTAALGEFAHGHVNVERFSSFIRTAARVDTTSEQPVRAAQRALEDLWQRGDQLFVLAVPRGTNLASALEGRLSAIGVAFAAAHVVDLATRGALDGQDRDLLKGLPYAQWSRAERALAPGLVIAIDGADFAPALAAPYLDAGMKMVFIVDGEAPAAAMSRLVTPGVFVEQASASDLKAFAGHEGTAVAALLEGGVEFVHDPAAAETAGERFTKLELPREIRKRSIGGFSPAQQAEDYALLEALAAPRSTPEAASDPAGKLSAWLLSKANLVDED